MRNADIWAMFLHPSICANLASKLLIDGARISRLSELVGKGAPNQKYLLGDAAGTWRWHDFDWYAYVEAASDPVFPPRNYDCASMQRAEV